MSVMIAKKRGMTDLVLARSVNRHDSDVIFECADDPVIAAGIFENLLVPASAQIALACMDRVAAIRTQQLDCGAR
jgi:hypothetical protein